MAETSAGGWVTRERMGRARMRFQPLANETVSAGVAERLSRIRLRASSTEIIALSPKPLSARQIPSCELRPPWSLSLVGAGLPARFVHQAHRLDPHAAVDRLAHVVD